MSSKYKVTENKYTNQYNTEVVSQYISFDANDDVLKIFLSPPRTKNTQNIWKFDDQDCMYMTDSNGRKMYFAHLVLNVEYNHDDYIVYLDKNPFNLIKSNLEIHNKYIQDCERELQSKYDQYTFLHHHRQSSGRSARKIRNPVWKVKEKENEFLVVFCENNVTFTCSVEDIAILDKKSTWYRLVNGYIGAHITTIKGSTIKYFHQLVMADQWNSDMKDQNLSIDHINQNKMDNRRSNLRIATQSLQNQNRGKKNRSSNARQLPDALVDYLASINKTNLPKFVTYNVDTVKGSMDHHYQREFFRIESQELLNRMGKCSWASSKSTKVSIVDKYKQTVAMIHKVQTQATNETTTTMKDLVIVDGAVVEKKTIPIPYTNMAFSRGKHCMVFDQRDANRKRLNLKMTIKTAEPTDADVEKFKNNLHKKYPDVKCIHDLII